MNKILHSTIYKLVLVTCIGAGTFSGQFSHAQTLTLLHSFAGGNTDGSTPWAGLVRDSSGNLYGTTYYGGTGGAGVVFKTTSTGTTTILHSFAGGNSDGAYPSFGSLVRDSSGNLYGTTYSGGTGGEGVVFKTTSTGTTTILHSFAGGNSDGAYAFAGLVMDSSGNLYGTTYYGGTGGAGVVFKTTSTGTTTILHSFSGGNSDGANPYAGLDMDSSGNLYGTTYSGSTGGAGVVFKTTSTGTTTVLHSFTGGNSDGANPYAGLVMDSSGNLYGTTYSGGAGVVFKTTSTGTTTILHSFAGGNSDGAHPYAGLVMDSSGNLYGTSLQGGSGGFGVVFKLN
jgi:uncharacterized repeat protein (TIGR03803 family)